LKFGKVSPFLGYNAFDDFFPKYPLTPNSDCSDSKCRELQKYYTEHPDKRRLKPEEEEKHSENKDAAVDH
jgi:ubiquitin-like modifier-activating enzyme 5